MHIDFSTVQDVESFVSIPEGTYPCRIAEVRSGLTREGAPRWALRLEVLEGDYAGRTAAWDGLVWSERGLPRVKAVLALLGYDVTGELDLDAEELVGQRLVAQLVTEEREDALSGRRIARLRVPYMGYAAWEGEEPGSVDPGDPIEPGEPF